MVAAGRLQNLAKCPLDIGIEVGSPILRNGFQECLREDARGLLQVPTAQVEPLFKRRAKWALPLAEKDFSLVPLRGLQHAAARSSKTVATIAIPQMQEVQDAFRKATRGPKTQLLVAAVWRFES